MFNLRTCYDKLKIKIPWDVEPYKVIESAEAHRNFWCPEKVRTLLLAESHVYTTETENTSLLREDICKEVGCPREFVKLVYCLGYGENEILTPTIAENPGTRQFWELFYSCLVNVDSKPDFSSIHKTKTRNTQQRLRNKIDILKDMRKKGIWLLDASPMALYNMPSAKAKTPEVCETVLLESWPHYLRPIIERITPENIIIIGKGVGNVLQHKLKTLGCDKIYCFPQPQARLPREVHLQTFQQCFQICSG
jgi:hypothetical protein